MTRLLKMQKVFVPVSEMLANNALQRTVVQRGPHLAAAPATWPAAELGR